MALAMATDRLGRVLDDDGDPLVTTCQGCGSFDYVTWVEPNGFEYCRECSEGEGS